MSRADGPFMMLSRRWKTDDGFLGLSLNARGAWLTLALHTEDTGSLVVSRIALGHVLGLRPSQKHQELGYFKELAAAGMVALSDDSVELIARHQTGQASRTRGQRIATPMATHRQRNGDAMAMHGQCVATAPSELTGESAPKNRIEQNRTEHIESPSPSAPPPALEQVAILAGQLELLGAPKPSTPKPATPKSSRASKPKTAAPEGDPAAAEPIGRWCAQWGIDQAHPEFSAFLLSHRSKGNQFVNWRDAWGTWLANDRKWSAQRRPATAGYVAPFRQPSAIQGPVVLRPPPQRTAEEIERDSKYVPNF